MLEPASVWAEKVLIFCSLIMTYFLIKHKSDSSLSFMNGPQTLTTIVSINFKKNDQTIGEKRMKQGNEGYIGHQDNPIL